MGNPRDHGGRDPRDTATAQGRLTPQLGEALRSLRREQDPDVRTLASRLGNKRCLRLWATSVWSLVPVAQDRRSGVTLWRACPALGGWLCLWAD